MSTQGYRLNIFFHSQSVYNPAAAHTAPEHFEAAADSEFALKSFTSDAENLFIDDVVDECSDNKDYCQTDECSKCDSVH